MIDDIITTIKAQLYDRVTSPLLGTFTIAWSIYNWKVILVLVSNLNAIEKINYLKLNIFTSKADTAIHGLAIPLIIALGMIYAYPLVSEHVYFFTRKHQHRLKQLKQTIDDPSPISPEEAAQLRQNMRSIQQKHDIEINAKDTTISELKASNARYESELTRANLALSENQNQHDEFKKSAFQAESKENELKLRLHNASEILRYCSLQVDIDPFGGPSRISAPEYMISLSNRINTDEYHKIEKPLEEYIEINNLFNKSTSVHTINSKPTLIIHSNPPRSFSLKPIHDNLASNLFIFKKCLDAISEAEKIKIKENSSS